MEIFKKIAGMLYDGMRRSRFRRLISGKVTMDLERLYPGAEREKLQRDYYVGKLAKTLLILLAGTALAALLGVRAEIDRKMDGENVLTRGDYTEEAQEVDLEAAVGKAVERFRIQMLPRQLGGEAADELFEKFCAELPSFIAGDNPSLEHVEKNLLLEERFDGYPFSVEWKSSNVNVIASSGEVRAGETDCEVELTAVVTYGETCWETSLTAHVLPVTRTEEEQRRLELETLLLESEQNSRMAEQWELPVFWQGDSVTWRRAVEDYSGILWAGTLAVAVLVYFMSDKDLHDGVERRKAAMRTAYPDLVHKLALYLGAGLTLRGSFHKIAAEYEQERNRGQPEQAAYEEVLYTCRELQTGVSEARAYEHFGRRTGLQEYIRLTTLLAQNLKKGNSTLPGRLREEADRASQERIQGGRKLGEEAATKLLIPMVMMLAVVLVIVMLPALTAMGS